MIGPILCYNATMNLEAILSQYDTCNLECDGLTRVLHTVLTRQTVAHTVKIGRIENTQTGVSFEPHFWIELPTGQIVDYRARMWLGQDAPHGIFNPADTPITYDGEPVELEPLSDSLFKILTELS
jgi:hypothetical protein